MSKNYNTTIFYRLQYLNYDFIFFLEVFEFINNAHLSLYPVAG